jgi:hypothetical protein
VGIGTIISKATVDEEHRPLNVLYVPELPKTLLSVRATMWHGMTMTFELLDWGG